MPSMIRHSAGIALRHLFPGLILGLPLCLAAVLVLAACPAEAQTRMSHIQLGKTSYRNGEQMVVRVMTRGGEGQVAVFPAQTPAGTWEELAGQARDQFLTDEDSPFTVHMLPVPLEAGEYEIRLFENGALTAAAPFRVEQVNGLRLEQSEFSLGEPVAVEFRAGTISVPDGPDWTLALVPADEPRGILNKAAALDTAPLGGEASGRVELAAPLHPGRYEVRMYDGQGRELDAAPLTVAQASRLKLDKGVVAAGDSLRVGFQADHLPDVWIGIVPADVDPDDAEDNMDEALAVQPLDGLTKGVLTFTTPSEQGNFEMRMFSAKDGRLLDAAPFETTAPAQPVEAVEPEPVVEPTPEPAPEPTPEHVVAQAEPKPAVEPDPVAEPVQAVEPIQAVEAAAGPVPPPEPRADTLSLDKKLARPGESLVVEFTAASTLGDTAWIGIVAPDQPRKGGQADREASPSSQSVAGLDQGSVILTAPEDLGLYEVRFFASDHGPQLASESFEATIRTTSILLERNRFAPGQPITAHYTLAESLPTAWMGILPSSLMSTDERKNRDRAQQVQFLAGRTGGTLSFTAPDKPGLYELRIFTGRTDGDMLFKKMFLVR